MFTQRQLHADDPSAEIDHQQVVCLCDNLSVRIETARAEEAALEELAAITARTRPFRSRQYRNLLEDARARFHKMEALLRRYCHLT